MPKTPSARSGRIAQPPQPEALDTHELALYSRRVLDIAPRTARVITFAGATGVVFLVVGSLLGNRPATIGVDKMLHLSGYAVLAALFILSLRPRWYLPALAGLATLGLLIEFLQPLNRRTFDLGDALFNAVGLAIGAAAGLGVRLTYGYVKTELASACVRRNLSAVEPGATIVREGAHIDQFFIVKSGTVALYRQGDGERVLVSCVGPGEMFGLLAEILRGPQHTTAVAATRVELYRIDYDDIIQDAGGPEQPVGAVLCMLAAQLREAWDTISSLQTSLSPESTPQVGAQIALGNEDEQLGQRPES
jgi:CRP-like cAMP-binding protein